MTGFFNLSELQRQPKRHMSVPGCGACGLHKHCITPKMEPSGDGGKGILFIAEAPGETEDMRGEPLVGKVGKLHRKTCRNLGINLDKDCRKINAVCCRPINNVTPKDEQINACRPNILKEIKNNKPKIIIPMGNVAIYSLLGHRTEDKPGGITRWRGLVIPDRELGCWVCPTFHPSFVMRNESNKAVEKIYRTDLEAAFWVLKNKEFPQFPNEEQRITRLMDTAHIRSYLIDLIKNPPIFAAFDYETTGLKPHAKGHRIVTAAISTERGRATAFPLSPSILKLWIRFLKSKKILKIAANLKFEETWSRVILGTKVEGWVWDTMLMQHCLDNRSGFNGLKFQTYVRYGLLDYDSHLSHLLKGVEDNANSFNQIHKIQIDDLLTYNGMDSIFEFQLGMDQMKEVGILDPPYYFRKMVIE